MNKKIIGYILFVLSFLMWLFPLFIKLFNLPIAQMAFLITLLIVLGEVFFVLSLVILGKAFWNNIKRFVKINWKWYWRKIHNNKKSH
jgi:hypothetical protein